MLPGFGGPESKSFFPIFFACAEKVNLCLHDSFIIYSRLLSRWPQKWKEAIELNSDQSITLNVTSWVSRAALDAIGEGE